MHKSSRSSKNLLLLNNHYKIVSLTKLRFSRAMKYSKMCFRNDIYLIKSSLLSIKHYELPSRANAKIGAGMFLKGLVGKLAPHS